jgi:hypothetical protein
MPSIAPLIDEGKVAGRGGYCIEAVVLNPAAACSSLQAPKTLLVDNHNRTGSLP